MDYSSWVVLSMFRKRVLLPLSMLPAWRVLFLVPLSVTTFQRFLRRADVTHANAWISALPSSVDGKDTVVSISLLSVFLSFLFLFLVLFVANHGFVWRSRPMLQKIK